MSRLERRHAVRWPEGWRRGLVLLAALLGVMLTARLGLWQLDRADQKRLLQSRIDQLAHLPELSAAQLADEPAGAPAQYGRQVRLHGRWLADKTVYLDNRLMAERVGFYVLTPLQLEGKSAVLVQRGWVPRDAAQRTRLPPLTRSEAEVEVLGRIGPDPSALYQFGGAESGLIRQNVELAAYAHETRLSLLPVLVTQLSSSPDVDDGLMRDWPAPAVGLHKHYGYAFQWFALSALLAGLYVWFQLIQPWLQYRRTSRQSEHSSEH